MRALGNCWLFLEANDTRLEFTKNFQSFLIDRVVIELSFRTPP